LELTETIQNPKSKIVSPVPHRGRFLILSVEAGPGRQGGKVDKEDFLQKMYFGFAQYKVC
jgi:hypothetical protein